MKTEKRLEKIAKRMLNLTLDIEKGRNVEEKEEEIQRLSSDLSVEDMLWIDEYIMNRMH